MSLLKANKENILKAVSVLKEGGLVAFPTETVYGLGASGLDAIAAAKIFEAKKRPAFNPLILHIADMEQLKIVANFDEPKIKTLIHKFWPGPLTLVLEKRNIVPDIISAGNPTVAVRMPDHPVALELIKLCQTPIAAPSANAFSKLSPTTAQHVASELGDRVDIILDGGRCPVGIESTIIQYKNGQFLLLRPGAVEREDIEKITGKLIYNKFSEVRPEAPGQLPFHYSPKIPVKFLDDENVEQYKSKKVGGLFFKSIENPGRFQIEKVLSESGDLREAAANLFHFLHEFENEDIDIILAEPAPTEGLGLAIMDRLQKAVNRFI